VPPGLGEVTGQSIVLSGGEVTQGELDGEDEVGPQVIEPQLDAESRIHDDHHPSVRLWLLPARTNRIEGVVRQRLQADSRPHCPGSTCSPSWNAPRRGCG
jgi:hypothetical protein